MSVEQSIPLGCCFLCAITWLVQCAPSLLVTVFTARGHHSFSRGYSGLARDAEFTPTNPGPRANEARMLPIRSPGGYQSTLFSIKCSIFSCSITRRFNTPNCAIPLYIPCNITITFPGYCLSDKIFAYKYDYISLRRSFLTYVAVNTNTPLFIFYRFCIRNERAKERGFDPCGVSSIIRQVSRNI